MSNSGKGSGKIPARAHNPKRIANRAASYKRGQERKAERRLAQSKRERANKERQSNLTGLEFRLTKWEQIQADQQGTRNKHFNVGTAQYVMSEPLRNPAKGQINPGRSVSIGMTLGAKGVVTGWAYACINCKTRKAYTHEHFQDPYGAAVSAGRDHMCSPQVWKSPVKELLAYAS